MLVKTDHTWLHGERFKREIYFREHDCMFRISIPDHIQVVIHCSHSVEGDTVVKVRKKWADLVKQYEGTKKKERKVIVYEFTGDHYSKDNVSIGLEYYVATEIITASVRRYLDMKGKEKQVYKKKRESSSMDQDCVIDWTQEREDFFKEMILSLDMARKKASKFFSQSRKKLLSFMDSRTKLLPFDGGQK